MIKPARSEVAHVRMNHPEHVTASMGEALSRFAQGERVERGTLVAKPGAASTATLHMVSGKTSSSVACPRSVGRPPELVENHRPFPRRQPAARWRRVA